MRVFGIQLELPSKKSCRQLLPISSSYGFLGTFVLVKSGHSSNESVNGSEGGTRQKVKMGFLMTPYAFNKDESDAMAKVGTSIIATHMGLTTYRSIGAKTSISLELEHLQSSMHSGARYRNSWEGARDQGWRQLFAGLIINYIKDPRIEQQPAKNSGKVSSREALRTKPEKQNRQRQMEETLVKGRQVQDDCSALVKKLRAIIHST